MPMTLVQQFVYFLGVALIYGAPLILLALYLSWRRQALIRGIALVITAWMGTAGALQVYSLVGMKADSLRYDSESRVLADYSGAGDATHVVPGHYVGTEAHGAYPYRVYQFPALDGSARWLEIVVPPGAINGAGYLRHADVRRSPLAAARLVVWPHAISMNPALAPEEFFDRHVAGEDAHAFAEHTLIVAFRARRSNVVYPPEPGATAWVWRDAVNDL